MEEKCCKQLADFADLKLSAVNHQSERDQNRKRQLEELEEAAETIKDNNQLVVKSMRPLTVKS